MTLNEFADLCDIVYGGLRVFSGYDSRVLCLNFRPNKKNEELGKREVRGIFPDLVVSGRGAGKYADAIICCVVDGRPEYEKAHGSKEM